MIGPLFQQKVYDLWSHFSGLGPIKVLMGPSSGLVYERPHFSDVSRYMQIFFVQRFFKAACFLGT